MTLSRVSPDIVKIDDHKYIEIHNINGGDVTQWSQSDDGKGYTQTRTLNIRGSAAFILISGGTWTGSKAWIGNEIGGGAHHVKLHRMTFSHHGTNAAADGDDRGDMLQITGDQVMVMSCSTEFCGHNGIVAQGNKGVYHYNQSGGS